MLPGKYEIRGAIGFYKNMGLKEVSIDFTGKEGLIAFAGPNGQGKSTLIELMPPFRTFASRKGSLRHHFFLRDSYIKKTFCFNDIWYQATLKIDSDSDRSEAFLVRMDANGEYTDSLVNGKNTPYDNFIKELFGPQNLFYNSVFCAQGSGGFANLGTGDIRKLFIDFLKLDRFVNGEKQAKDAIGFFNGKRDILLSEINTLSLSVENLLDLRVQLKTLESNRLSKTEILTNNAKSIETFGIEIENLNKSKLLNASNVEKKNDLDTQLAGIVNELAKLNEKSVNTKTDFEGKLLEFNNSVASLDEIIENKDRINTAILKTESLTIKEKHFQESMQCALAAKTPIESDVKDIGVLVDENTTIIEGYSDDIITNRYVSKNTDLQAELLTPTQEKSNLLVKLTACDNNSRLIQIISEISSLSDTIALAIDPDCTSTDCPALKNIADSKIKLPVLKKEKIELESSIAKAKKQLNIDITAKADEIDQISESIRLNTIELEKRRNAVAVEVNKLKSQRSEYTASIENLTDELQFVNATMTFYAESANQRSAWIKQLAPMVEKKAEFDTAEIRKSDIEKHIEALNTSNAADKKEISESLKAKLQSSTELTTKLEDVKKLIIDGVDTKITTAQGQITVLEGDKLTLESSKAQIGKEIAVLESSIKLKTTEQIALDLKNKILKYIDSEISDFAYLRDAFSKKGLQALEISGVTPLIVSESNQMLENAFGMAFQIKIITKDPDTLKEVFDIKVIRSDGSEDDFDMLSPGQKVWLSDALSFGMTLVSKKKSGRNLETLFADEKDGALDPQKAVELFSMYRSVMQEGSFKTCCFISHKPEIVDMADHVLDFSSNGLSWRY